VRNFSTDMWPNSNHCILGSVGGGDHFPRFSAAG
jgi:hypothetical protein